MTLSKVQWNQHQSIYFTSGNVSAIDYLEGIKEGLYRIQILCRRHPFWSYPAGLTIADPPG